MKRADMHIPLAHTLMKSLCVLLPHIVGIGACAVSTIAVCCWLMLSLLLCVAVVVRETG